jgi:hypothetical protein
MPVIWRKQKKGLPEVDPPGRASRDDLRCRYSCTYLTFCCLFRDDLSAWLVLKWHGMARFSRPIFALWFGNPHKSLGVRPQKIDLLFDEWSPECLIIIRLILGWHEIARLDAADFRVFGSSGDRIFDGPWRTKYTRLARPQTSTRPEPDPSCSITAVSRPSLCH